MRQPMTCYTDASLRARSERVPSAVWLFDNEQDARAWAVHLRKSNKDKCRVFGRPIHVDGVTLLVWCLSINRPR